MTSLRPSVAALIFDMDGTMIDSMPAHAQSWIAFVQQHGININVPDLMRRTTGRTGAECMRELFGRDLSNEEAWGYIVEKEQAYRAAVCPIDPCAWPQSRCGHGRRPA